jgi:GTP-binding protein Era
MPRAGIVTVSGRPNAGKSTLLNRMVGQKLSITSGKPQSTRNRVVGIITRDDAQIILADTPGLMEPKYALQHVMRSTALAAIADADVILHVIDASGERYVPFVSAAGLTREPSAPIITVFNKSDLVRDDERARLRATFPEAVLVLATTGTGIQELLDRIRALLPESPFLYDESDVSAQSVRYFAAELVREAALEQLRGEVPYAVACAIEEFREGGIPVYIRAVMYVERESQKRILIGHKGSRIGEIGRAARLKIEALIDAPVYLDLWVKVLGNWRRDANALRRLGFAVPEDL